MVIFDFDGTLADSAGWFAGVLNGVARRYRFREATRADFEMLRHADARTILRHLGVARWKLPFIARHMRRLMARDIEEIKLFPGVERLVRDLHAAGVRLAIVSSNARANIDAVLGPEIVRLIDHFACGASLFGKTAKFRSVLEWAGAPPSEVIAIGDEVRDIDAAAITGIASGAVTWGYAAKDALIARGPTVVFDAVDAIAPFVAAGRGRTR